MNAPVRPDEKDCCNSGCNPCIFDVYEMQLKKYETKKPFDNLKNCMSAINYTIFELIEIAPLTCDTNLYTFRYVKQLKGVSETPLNELELFYKPGQHFLLRGCSNEDDFFTRAYTPIPNTAKSNLSFVVLIKLYKNGKMSDFIKKLVVGSETAWRGPYGDYVINFSYKQMLFIAQGTGVAPLYSIIHDLLNNEACETFLTLFFCCRNVNNIILRDELYKLSSYWNFRYEIFLSNDKNVQIKYNETIHTNRLQNSYVKNYLRGKNEGDSQVLVCGSEKFNESMLNVLLTDLNFNKKFVYVF